MRKASRKIFMHSFNQFSIVRPELVRFVSFPHSYRIELFISDGDLVVDDFVREDVTDGERDGESVSLVASALPGLDHGFVRGECRVLVSPAAARHRAVVCPRHASFLSEVVKFNKIPTKNYEFRRERRLKREFKNEKYTFSRKEKRANERRREKRKMERRMQCVCRIERGREK